MNKIKKYLGLSSGEELNVKEIRKCFPAISSGRIISNNGASTQVPQKLIDSYKKLIPIYDNVHRGQSDSSLQTTALFEGAYETIADFIGASSKEEVVLYRNATEAINAVMYSLMTEFKDGDNVVTTMMEHNSNYIPWYGLCNEILPRFGIKVECRVARFDKVTGELDLEHLKSLVDNRTKIVCCTAASNFFGVKNPLEKVRKIAKASGYVQPNKEKGSYFLVDGCQYVPHHFVDVKAMKVDFFAWSFHKMLAPFGVGGLYARKELLSNMKPFLYGGDMIADGQVTLEKVGYNILPWKFTAGTPNILGTILSAQAIKCILDLTSNPGKEKYLLGNSILKRSDVKKAMNKIENYENELTKIALKEFSKIDSVHLFGPKDYKIKTPLFAFVAKDKKLSPFKIAEELNKMGIESRAGCHCATLAHHYYHLDPPASCRLSFYFYNTPEEVIKSIQAVKKICG